MQYIWCLGSNNSSALWHSSAISTINRWLLNGRGHTLDFHHSNTICNIWRMCMKGIIMISLCIIRRMCSCCPWRRRIGRMLRIRLSICRRCWPQGITTAIYSLPHTINHLPMVIANVSNRWRLINLKSLPRPLLTPQRYKIANTNNLRSHSLPKAIYFPE